MEHLPVPSVVWQHNGLFMEVHDRQDDFWLFMGKLVGWVRFSLFEERHPGTNNATLFEAVEVLPPTFPAPTPLVSIPNVLWRRREAIEAEIGISLYLADLARLEAETLQGGQGSHH